MHHMSRTLAPALLVVVAVVLVYMTSPALWAREYVHSEPAADTFPLAAEDKAADVFVDENDWKVARIAACDLALDIQRVTGRKPAVKHTPAELSEYAVLIGTLGKSPVIDRLAAAGRLEVDDIQGRWETSVIVPVADPLPAVKQALVIAGSDRRGTAYGVYELSRRIGVSPWYWWADVTPRHRETLYLAPDRVRLGPPAVKYRGIFINDEMWGIRPWASGNFAPEEGQGLGPKTYARIFELLLRLRANYLWPAMHRGTIPFNYYPRNKLVADDYAIVMGSSHIEPMLRNNIYGAEWDQEGSGEWNYRTNRRAIYDYWERRIETNGRFENVYTLGMRGQDDEPMKAGRNAQEKIELLEQIFRDQREILRKHVDPDLSKVAQVFIPYTEVLGIYDAGLKVPDDVTICWPDDNFGYIRRLPTPEEQARRGGSGIYYHIQWLNGATTAYTWLNTTPPALIFEEMSKAWQYGARRLWVLNVGDIKPGEIGMEFFLQMAWDPQRRQPETLRNFLAEWAARDIDPRFAPQIAAIMEEYFRLGFARRPEHLVQYRSGMPLQYSWFSHQHYNDEAQQRLDRYARIAQCAERIYGQLPRERRDAFFQLVLYPVQCAALMNQKIIYADKSMRYGAAGRASAGEYAKKARAASARIIELTEHYNTGLVTAGAKWNYMMTWAPGPWGRQFYQFVMPPLSDFDGAGPPRLKVALEGGHGEVLADLSVYTQGRRFIDLFNTGKGRIDWQATPSEPWVRLSQTQGSFTTEQRLWVSVDWQSVPAGDHIEATIDIRSSAGEKRIVLPLFDPQRPDRDTVSGFVESHGYVSMEAEHYSRRIDRHGAAWRVVQGLGRSGDSVTVLPASVPSRTDPAAIRAHSPALQYDVYLFSTGNVQLHIDCLPTRPVGPDRGVRLAASIDQTEPQVLGENPRFAGDVLANLRRYETSLAIHKPGPHTLTIWMVDPGVVIDKIVLYTAAPRESYLGPPESFRH